MALLLAYLQFRYEVAHVKEEETARRTAAQLLEQRQFVSADSQIEILNRIEAVVRTRYDADRAYILLNSLAAAVVGELVSAFGGLTLRFLS
jgi:hypothetical protein